MTCEILKAGLAGKCACGEQLEGDCHVIKDQRGVLDLKCKACCPVCSAALEWAAPAKTITGEQEGLF